MTRIEAEEDVRRIERRCKGNWLLPENERAVLNNKFHEIMAARDFEDAMRFKVALEVALELSEDKIEDGNWDRLIFRVLEIIFGCRENCGYDVNELICRYPFDGADHSVPCPKCGTNADFSVRYELES